jgi:hypothetical protein
MQQFVTSFQNYIIQQVHRSEWQGFVGRIQQASSVEQLSAEHRRYLDAMLEKCLITKGASRVQDLLESMFQCIFRFCAEMQRSPVDAAKCTEIFGKFRKSCHFLCEVLRIMTSVKKNDHIDALLLTWDFNRHYRNRPK